MVGGDRQSGAAELFDGAFLPNADPTAAWLTLTSGTHYLDDVSDGWAVCGRAAASGVTDLGSHAPLSSTTVEPQRTQTCASDCVVVTVGGRSAIPSSPQRIHVTSCAEQVLVSGHRARRLHQFSGTTTDTTRCSSRGAASGAASHQADGRCASNAR